VKRLVAIAALALAFAVYGAGHVVRVTLDGYLASPSPAHPPRP
jgi:hypothetical protein